MISLSNGAVSGEAISGSFSGYFRNRIEVYDEIAGTKQLTIPAGWNKIRVAVVGGGGGGYQSTGGGGGGYSEITLDVVPGTTYTYTVGAAGVGGVVNTSGGTSSFGGLISATGGGKGIYPKSVGGVGIGGSINTTGGISNSGGDSNYGSGGGSSANRFGNGGNGSISTNSAAGNGGSWPNYPRPLLYEDGFGLGITPYTLIDTGSVAPVGMVGAGQTDYGTRVNIGGGGVGLIPLGSANVTVYRAGVGGGGGGTGGNYNSTKSYGAGGNGLVIVEVLA